MTTNDTLCAPESIHTLSAMGEALEEWFNAYESEDERLEKDYPMDWIEEVCECNHWQLWKVASGAMKISAPMAVSIST